MAASPPAFPVWGMAMAFTGEDDSEAGSGPVGRRTRRVVLAGGTTSAYDVAVSVTRTADTNIYAANDVIGAATGATAAIEFANIGPSGGSIRIIGTEMAINVAAVISGMTSFRLHLYSVTPPSALGDNAPWDLPAGDRASYLGFLDLGAPVDLGSTLYVQAEQAKDVKLLGTSLFAYPVTIGTFTPSSAAVKKFTVHALAK